MSRSCFFIIIYIQEVTIMAHFINVSQLDQVIDALCAANDARFQKKSDVLSYTIKELGTADTGYAHTYQLYSVSADSTPVETPIANAKINIPKDFLVKSASLDTVTAADKEAGGKFADNTDFAVGDKYIDFVVNVKEGSATDEHIYLNVKDLVDVYTAGNGIDVSNANAISINIDSNNANGLSVSANGLALAVAVASTSGVGGSAGAMSAADKEKLDGIEEATSTEIQDIIDGMYAVASSGD
jgi:hypothetical protein